MRGNKLVCWGFDRNQQVSGLPGANCTFLGGSKAWSEQRCVSDGSIPEQDATPVLRESNNDMQQKGWGGKKKSVQHQGWLLVSAGNRHTCAIDMRSELNDCEPGCTL